MMVATAGGPSSGEASGLRSRQRVPLRNDGAARIVIKSSSLHDIVQLGNLIMTTDDRAALTAAQDRLLNLLVQQDEASELKDWARVNTLETEIEAARTRRDKLQRPR